MIICFSLTAYCIHIKSNILFHVLLKVTNIFNIFLQDLFFIHCCSIWDYVDICSSSLVIKEIVYMWTASVRNELAGVSASRALALCACHSIQPTLRQHFLITFTKCSDSLRVALIFLLLLSCVGGAQMHGRRVESCCWTGITWSTWGSEWRSFFFENGSLSRLRERLGRVG